MNTEKIVRRLEKPSTLKWDLLRLISPLLSDKQYMKSRFKIKTGKVLDLDHPKTYNEKLQWIMLYDRRPLYTLMVDKFAVKEFIAGIIGKDYLVPTIASWDSVDEIDFNSLPNQFVLKANNGVGGLVICSNKSKLDIVRAKKRLDKALHMDLYKLTREWPYKNVPPKLFAEAYLGSNLQDYRVYCFNGEPKMIYSYTNQSREDGNKPDLPYCDIFDCEWNPMPFHQKALPKGNVPKPHGLDVMLDCSRRISKGIPHLRVDFYEVNGKVYIGELTLFAGAGMSKFYPEEWDGILGSWIVLPEK